MSGEFFGRGFNQQLIAIFDVLEPSDVGKALVEFYTDMKILATGGIYLAYESMGRRLHKAFLKGDLADVVARYVGVSHNLPLPLPLQLHLPRQCTTASCISRYFL